MGCLIALLALGSPRLAMGAVWLFTDRVSLAFDNSVVVPLLGFLFLPWTALAWTLAHAPIIGVTGWGWVVVGIALLTDVGSYGGGARAGRP
jgi:hypothetical protein